MKIVRLATQFQHSMMAFVLAGVCPGGALPQNGHSHEATAQPQQLTSAQSALLKTVRDNTERFKDVSVAEREGYSLLFGCVSGPDSGAMGLHYVNLSLDRKSTRLNSSHSQISYAVFCLKKKKNTAITISTHLCNNSFIQLPLRVQR